MDTASSAPAPSPVLSVRGRLQLACPSRWVDGKGSTFRQQELLNYSTPPLTFPVATAAQAARDVRQQHPWVGGGPGSVDLPLRDEGTGNAVCKGEVISLFLFFFFWPGPGRPDPERPGLGGQFLGGQVWGLSCPGRRFNGGQAWNPGNAWPPCDRMF